MGMEIAESQPQSEMQADNGGPGLRYVKEAASGRLRVTDFHDQRETAVTAEAT